MGAMGRKLDLVTLVLLILEFISWLVYMAATGESTGVGQRCSHSRVGVGWGEACGGERHQGRQQAHQPCLAGSSEQ